MIKGRRLTAQFYIEEKYTGDKTLLKDFKRTYQFVLINNSDLVYSSFSEAGTYSGGDFSINYLLLK